MKILGKVIVYLDLPLLPWLGKPRPVVTWWRDKRLVDANFTVAGDGNVVRNRFHIHELKRSDFLTVLTCQAVNNNVTVAASRSITLDMNREF